MKAFRNFVTIALTLSLPILRGQTSLDPIQKLEAAGDIASARSMLLRAAEADPNNPATLTRYAEFLERYGDPAARDTYAKALALLQRTNDKERSGAIAHKLVILDLLAGDPNATSSHLDVYRQATGKTLSLSSSANRSVGETHTAPIPGPLRSFARMAAISPDSSPDDILPALARNVVTNGYQASHSNDALEQTEYLKLVHRYLTQARELEKLAGDKKVISIENCESTTVAELLRILGFRMRGGCGSEVVLETVNAARAFLTTDSGFPVNKLEEALRTNRPFTYDFHAAMVPVLFSADYWMTGAKDSPGFVETLIGDPSACRLYLGLSKLDHETAEAMRKASSYTHLKAFAHVLDFFGGMFEIRQGKAVV